MASIGFMVTTAFGICWISIQVSAAGEIFERNVTLTWNESLKYCEGIEKVLFDVKKSKSYAILMGLLNDTDQAWVANTVELSDFIKIPVCKGTSGLQSTANKTFDTNIIGNCLKFCNEHLYIGLKGRDCFCFKDVKHLTGSNSCNSTCNNYTIHLCGGNESLSLYEKVETHITQEIAAGFKECVYAENNGSFTKLFTASCVGTLAEGGMCEIDENSSECTNHNWTLAGSRHCRMDLAFSSEWKEVKEMCALIGRQLVSPSNLPLNLEDRRRYWLGIHRLATIHEAEEQKFLTNSTHCAVARKEGDILLIEGEDCKEKHAILCQDEDIPESTASSRPNSSKTSNPGKGSNSKDADDTIIYVVAALSVMLLVAIVITATACVFRRRQISQHTNVSTTNSSSKHHALLQNQSTNPPAKPLRKAHSMKEHVQIAYENIVPVHSEQDVEIQQQGLSNSAEEDYDKIELDKEHRQENDYKEDGIHIYDHTFLRTTEEHYDLTDFSGDKTPIPSITYDTTTLTQKVDTINSVHEDDCKVKLKTYRELDNDLYTTMGQT